MFAVAAPAPAANPGAVVGAIGDQDLAQWLGSEAIAPLVDEREALTRRRVMDQRRRGLAQDLVLATQLLVLTLTATQLLAQLGERGNEITMACSTKHARILSRQARERDHLTEPYCNINSAVTAMPLDYGGVHKP